MRLAADGATTESTADEHRAECDVLSTSNAALAIDCVDTGGKFVRLINKSVNVRALRLLGCVRILLRL